MRCSTVTSHAAQDCDAHQLLTPSRSGFASVALTADAVPLSCSRGSPSLSCRLMSAPASINSFTHLALPVAATKWSALRQHRQKQRAHTRCQRTTLQIQVALRCLPRGLLCRIQTVSNPLAPLLLLSLLQLPSLQLCQQLLCAPPALLLLTCACSHRPPGSGSACHTAAWT